MRAISVKSLCVMSEQKFDEFGDPIEEIIYVSRAELKRDMQELKDIGQRLMEMKPSLLDKLSLNERLRAALDESKRIKSHNARKRHLGFIGKTDAGSGY